MENIQHHPTSLLFVEGSDDFHVLHHLCNDSKISVRNLDNKKGGDFSIVDCGGFDKMPDRITYMLSKFRIKKFGIIVDADTNLKSRWDSLKNLLTKKGFEVPNTLPQQGLILTNKENIKVGVWIMPNNDHNGMLEDFISFLIPKDDMLVPFINDNLDTIQKNGWNKDSLIPRPKAFIHSWLALQEEPGSPLGQAITKRYLTTDQVTCKRLIDWLNALFIEQLQA